MTARVTLAVFDRDDMVTPVAEPTTWWPEGNDVFLDELDDQGGLSFNVQADDPDIGSIEAGQILVVSLDAAPIWRGVIRERTTREVAATEADRYSTFVGTGEVGRLDEIVVYPTGGLGRFPFSDEVRFDWTHPSFDDGTWVAAVITPANYGDPDENYGLPEGFPWGDADWIWDEDSSGSVPGGIKYMRLAVNVAEAGTYQAWSAADDRNEVHISGKSVMKSSDAPYSGEPTAVELYMTAGWAQLAAEVENRNDLKAGFLFGIGKPNDDTATPFALSSTSWVIAPDGAILGMNAGQIADIILDAFEGHLTANGITPVAGVNVPSRTWTSLLDSAGNPWEVYEELSAQVKNSTLLDALRQMIELEMCDVRMSPDAYELNLYNPGDAGTLIDYTLGDSNLASLTYDETPSVATSLLIRWQRGYTDVSVPGLVAEYGLRQSGLDLGGVGSASTAQTQGRQVIRQFGRPRAEIAATIEPEDVAHEPYTLYRPGDSIKAPTPGSQTGFGSGFFGDGVFGDDGEDRTSGHRIMAIGMGLDETGNPTWDVHLNSTIAEQEKRQALALKKLAANVGGRSQNTTVPYEPRPIQVKPPEPVIFSQDDGITVRESGPLDFGASRRVREVNVLIAPASTSGDVTVVAKKNGTTFATVTVAEGEQRSYVPVDGVVLDQRSDILTVATTAVGTGVESLTAKVT